MGRALPLLRREERWTPSPARGFDLVLLDLGLPDLDGVEVCRRIRAAHPATVIVMLAARSEEMDVVVGLEAGADDYLTMPVRFGELGTSVSRESLMADVWDAHWFGSTKTPDVHVPAVRRKLATAREGRTAPEITTLRGHGYRLQSTSE